MNQTPHCCGSWSLAPAGRARRLRQAWRRFRRWLDPHQSPGESITQNSTCVRPGHGPSGSRGVVGPLRCVLQKGLGHTRCGVRIGSKKDTRGKATPARALGRGLRREGMPLRQLRRRRAAGRSGRRVGVGWWRWDRAGLRTGPGRRDAPHARWLRELEGAGGEGDVVLKSTPSARRH